MHTDINHCFPMPTPQQLRTLPVLDRILEQNAILWAALNNSLPRDWGGDCLDVAFAKEEGRA